MSAFYKSSPQELKQYLLELANQPESLFGRTVNQFVACTRSDSVLTNIKRFDQFKHKLKDFHLPGSSSDFFFSLGISRIRTFLWSGSRR